MSLLFTTVDEVGVEVSLHPHERGVDVQIGQYRFALGTLGGMAEIFLGGGLFGWPNGKILPEVNQVISHFFDHFENKDGEWKRKRRVRIYEKKWSAGKYSEKEKTVVEVMKDATICMTRNQVAALATQRTSTDLSVPAAGGILSDLFHDEMISRFYAGRGENNHPVYVYYMHQDVRDSLKQPIAV